jgi:hypothetical protein
MTLLCAIVSASLNKQWKWAKTEGWLLLNSLCVVSCSETIPLHIWEYNFIYLQCFVCLEVRRHHHTRHTQRETGKILGKNSCCDI